MKKILIVDGNSLLFRAYYATSYGELMRSRNGVYTNAIYAFANMLNKVLDIHKPSYALIAFDTDKKTFRHTEFDFYKANRKSAPQELVAQFPLARELVTKMGIKVYEKEGYEADDIVATVARVGEENGLKVEIFSSDRDLLQLVSDKSSVSLIKKGIGDLEVVTPDYLKKEYSLEPWQVVEYKGLRGDASDNIPGVKGIGEVTALKLLSEYGSIENIYQNIDKIEGKLKEKLIEGKEMAFISKRIATINREVPLDFTLDEIVYQGAKKELLEFYQNYDMNSLASKLSFTKEDNFVYEIVDDLPSSFLVNDLGLFAYYKEDNYHLGNLIGLGLSNGQKAYYLSKESLLKNEKIIRYLSDINIKKSCFDLKATKFVFERLGINFEGCDFDIKIATYLLDCNLKDDLVSVFNKYGVSLKDASKIEEYASFIAYHTSLLKKEIFESLEKDEMLDLYQNVEHLLIEVLYKMEKSGVRVDNQILNQLGVEYRFKLNMIEDEIYSLVGHKFNIASPKQVGEVLFDELHLPSNKKRSTASEELEKLASYHPAIEQILLYRKYAKLLSTYIDGLLVHIKEDGKIHAIFNQSQTQTGRLSSSEPNMQNISVRDEESREIRKAFVSSFSDGHILSIDYSQVELRLLASIAKDSAMIESFKKGEDIHSSTASAIFGLPLEMVTSSMRRQAKAINFGIVYGISDWGLSEQLKIPPRESKQFIDKYFQTYPNIKKYLDDIVKKCQEDGFVTTLFKRRREVKEINHSSYMVREFGKRIAMNSPIQGTAADVIKIAMINVNDYLTKNNFKSKMIMQIHDELVFDVASDEVEVLIPNLKAIMEESVKLDVKLKVEHGIGKNWYEAK